MTQVLTIPRWHPTSLNELTGPNIGKRMRLKRGDTDLVIAHAHQQGITRAAGPRHVRITIVLGPGQRALDPDNYLKSCLDALKRAGLLVDDRRQMVTTEPVLFDRAPVKATEIILTDNIEPAPKAPRKPKAAKT